MTVTLAQAGALFTSTGLAVAGAAAVSIPIAIHLLARFRRRREPWAAMRFLAQAFKQHRRRLQLEQLLLLLVRCAIALTIGLALAGPIAGGLLRFFGTGSSQRLVLLVIDDSLSTRAGQRFEPLRQMALTIVDDLAPTDQVGLWQAARPQQMVTAPGAVDRGALRQTIESMRPRFSRSDLIGALASVAEQVNERDLPADQVFVFVLSDLAPDALDLSAQLPSGVADLGRRANVIVARPAADTANVQVAQLQPRRGMVLADPSMPTSIPLELTLRRFADTSSQSLAGLEVTLLSGEGSRAVSRQQRNFRWSAGQSSASLNLEVPVAAEDVPALAGRTLIVQTRLDTAGAPDAIEVDNQRWALVELRDRLRVGLIGEGDGGGDPTDITARDWIQLALSPHQGAAPRTGPIQIQDIHAADLDPARLSRLDAALVLRPDLLSPQALEALTVFVQRGGLLWIFPPARESAGVWGNQFAQALGGDLEVGVEPVDLDTPDDDPDDAGTSRAARLAADTSLPGPLNLLGADWELMLRPVRLSQRVPIERRAGEGDAAWEDWLRTGDGATLLIGRTWGEGYVLLSGVAMDTDWTNLPTKPLFIALMHEALRGTLGAPEQGEVVAGDRPVLGWRWSEAQRLERLGGQAMVALEASEQGKVPQQPLDRPGVYQAVPEAVGQKLAVNVESVAGDTTGLDPRRVADHLGRLGPWQWLDEAQPSAALLAEPERADLGWPLLWLVLGLVVLETLLARWFSHARPAPGIAQTA